MTRKADKRVEEFGYPTSGALTDALRIHLANIASDTPLRVKAGNKQYVVTMLVVLPTHVEIVVEPEN
mgnify:CR=1 FL=1